MAEVKIEGITPEGTGRIVASVLAGHRFEVELPIKKTMRAALDAIENTMAEFSAQEAPAVQRVESEPVYIPDLSGADEGGHLVVEAWQVSGFAQQAVGRHAPPPLLHLRWRSSRSTHCPSSWEVGLPFREWEKVLAAAKRQLRKATGDEWPASERALARG